MRFFSLFPTSLAIFVGCSGLASSASPDEAGPTLKEIQRVDGETTGKYIVMFKDGASHRAWAEALGVTVEHSWDIINGISGSFDDDALFALRASDDVEYITEDSLVHAFATITETITEKSGPWGLSRISLKEKLSNSDPFSLDFPYTYDSSAGAGVDIYILDTGVRVTHSEFASGRAIWGISFVGETTDNDGHGTHCAAIAAGLMFGVAKNASIVSVQVLDRDGRGSAFSVISGLQYAKDRASETGRPSVISLSLGGPADRALDHAVTQLTALGLHVVTGAGSANEDARNDSPARVASVITVAASDINDAKAEWSNFGRAIDIWAPGVDVLSAWGDSDSAMKFMSGSSQAVPHVAGVIAYLIGKDGNIEPAEMATKLINLSVSDALSGVPSGTVNRLLQTDPLPATIFGDLSDVDQEILAADMAENL